MGLGADWLKHLEKKTHTCACIFVCVWKYARSCAERHVMEKVWSEGGFACRYDAKKKKKKSWFSKQTSGSLLGPAAFCFDDVMFSSGGWGQVFNHSCQAQAANRASEVYLQNYNELEWRADPWSAFWWFACGLCSFNCAATSYWEWWEMKSALYEHSDACKLIM